MSAATHAVLAPSLLDADALAAVGRGAAVAGRVLGLVAAGLMLAAALWLVLAGPGFMADSPRPARAAHRG